MRSGPTWSALAGVVFLLLPQPPVSAQPAAAGRTSRGADPVRVAWSGRHPEAEEVAAVLRRLRQRLVKEGRDAREQGRWEVSMECEEEIGQVGEIWRILEELNGENIPLELEMHPSEL